MTQHAPVKPIAPPVSLGVLYGLLGFASLLIVGLSIAGWLTLPPHEPRILLIAALWLMYFVLPPLGFWLSSKLINRYHLGGEKLIHPRNAVAFGLLFACVLMLWRMGAGA